MKKIYIDEIISHIPNALDYKLLGNFNKDIFITNASSTLKSNIDSITFIDKSKSNEEKNLWISKTKSKMVITDINYAIKNKINIYTENPKFLFSILVNKLFLEQEKKGIHHSAIISKKATIGNDCYVAAGVIINDEVSIGDNCKIYENVIINKNTKIGNNVIIYSGAVIGSSGFGHMKNNKIGTVSFPHIGKVVINDNVEIGCNTCIDKGALSNTVIGKDVKINNLVHIAHNVEIGEGSWILANVMISGSVKIGFNCYIAPSSSIRDGVKVGNNTTIGMGAVVTKNVPPDEIWYGAPARKID